MGRVCPNKANVHAHTQLPWSMHSDGREISIQLQSETGKPSHTAGILASINESSQTDLLWTGSSVPSGALKKVSMLWLGSRQTDLVLSTTCVGHSHCFAQINRKHGHIFSIFVLQFSDKISPLGVFPGGLLLQAFQFHFIS